MTSKKKDQWYVQIVSPSGRVTYMTERCTEREGKEHGKSFDDPDEAQDAANQYRATYCKNQTVLVHVVPLIEEY